MKAVLALVLATLMGVNAHSHNSTNATTAAATQAAVVTTAAATTSGNGTASTPTVTEGASTGGEGAGAAAEKAAAVGNNTYTAEVEVTASMLLPNGTTVAALSDMTSTDTVVVALRASLAAGFKTASGLDAAATVTVKSIAAARRRALEERRELTATALKVTYTVVFPATADAAAVDTFADKVQSDAFKTDFTSAVTTAVKANAALNTAAVCGVNGELCAVSGVSVAAPTIKKGTAAVTLDELKADAGTAASPTPSSANAKFAGLTAVAAVLGMMAF